MGTPLTGSAARVLESERQTVITAVAREPGLAIRRLRSIT